MLRYVMKSQTKSICAALTILFLAGCTTAQLNDSISSYNNKMKELTSGLNTPQQTKNNNSLANTKIAGIFKQYLSTDGSTPEWPKIAIRDLEIPENQLDWKHPLKLAANECIQFNATLWMNEKNKEEINNISLCSQNLPKQSNTFVTTWKSWPISGKTTGQIRTAGPTPPYNKLPSDPKIENWIMHQFGLYYIGSIITETGIDPNFTKDDRRLWIVNIK